MNPSLDICFTLTGTAPIPADHGYQLYSAVSNAVPALHESNGFAIHPIAGQQVGDRRMMLTPQSRLTLRVPDGRISEVLPLAGRELTIGSTKLRVSVPQVRALIPATALRSRLVVIKIKDAPTAKDITPALFEAAARRQLDQKNISSEAQITLGKRRTLRIKQKEIVGYEVILEALTAEESLAVQEQGLGGRHHMTAGVFVPFEKKGS